jgi:hypothetical protein
MATRTLRRLGLTCGGIIAMLILFASAPLGADDPEDQFGACLTGQAQRVRQGFEIAPVRLNLEGNGLALVGLGSYTVNAQGGCNDCYTNPPYAEGGNPFAGEPEQINTAAYLAGGMPFGPALFSANITPCEDGKSAGLTPEAFIQLMRTGVDSDDQHLLQVMPWPLYGKMTDCDLAAMYAYLQTIPPHPGCELPATP